MAEHYIRGYHDAFGRPISDEDWAADERIRARYRAEDKAREDAEAAANAPLGWAPYLEGLGAEAANGLLFNAPNMIPAVKQETSNFEAKYPIAANVAWLAGLVPDLAANLTARAVGAGGRLLFRGAESVVPKAVQGLSSGIGKVGDLIASLSPARQADRVATMVTSSLPLVRRSTTVAPTVLSSALQGGATAYTSADPNDPDLTNTVLKGAAVGGTLGGMLGGAAKYVAPVASSILGKGQITKNNAIQKVLESSGLKSEDFLNRLSQLGNNARVYDTNPTTLGASGLLKGTASSSRKLLDNVRNNAISDIDSIIGDSQGLTAKHLGETLPGDYDDYISTAKNAKIQTTAPLYAISDKTPVDLASHPELLNHYVLKNDFANYLKGQLNDVTDPMKIININKFLNNRDHVVNASKQVINAISENPENAEALSNAYGKIINNHIADNNLDLSIPNHLIQDYVDDAVRNRPPISQEYTRLTQNPVNDATRLADTTSRAIQQISPEYANAQQTFARLSIPENQATLAQTLTKGGIENTKLDSQVTRDFIERNQNLAQRAAEAGLPNNMRPLTRYVLDENINKAVQRDTQKYPQAILDTIDNRVQPRLESVYGQEPVSNLIKDATNNAQYLANRTNLANLGLGNNQNDGLGLEFLHKISPKLKTAVGYGTRLLRSANAINNRAVVDFLQRNPEEARALMQEYLARNPGGDLNGYARYISAIMGNFAGGRAADSVYIPTEEDRRREILGY